MKYHPITLVDITTTEVVESNNVALRDGESGKHQMLAFLPEWIECEAIEKLVFSVEAGDPVLYVQMQGGRDFQIAINKNEEV